MAIELTESLARTLWALHQEALGGYDTSLWDDELTTIEREAWIQLAQYIEAGFRAVDTIEEAPDHK